jgi:hypothetical protein
MLQALPALAKGSAGSRLRRRGETRSVRLGLRRLHLPALPG